MDIESRWTKSYSLSTLSTGDRDWLKTGIFYRAVPWSRLILASGHPPRDLNLQTPYIISAVLVGLLILTIPLFFWDTVNLFGLPINIVFFILFLLLIITLIILNRGLYTFFYRMRDKIHNPSHPNTFPILLL